jgi:hypothetical protein
MPFLGDILIYFQSYELLRHHQIGAVKLVAKINRTGYNRTVWHPDWLSVTVFISCWTSFACLLKNGSFGTVSAVLKFLMPHIVVLCGICLG